MEKITDYSQLKKGDLCSFSVEQDCIRKNFVDVFIEIEGDGDLDFDDRIVFEKSILALYRLEHADNRIIVGDVWTDWNNNIIEIIGSDASGIHIIKNGTPNWNEREVFLKTHKKSNAPTEVEKAIKVLEDAGRIKNGKIIE